MVSKNSNTQRGPEPTDGLRASLHLSGMTMKVLPIVVGFALRTAAVSAEPEVDTTAEINGIQMHFTMRGEGQPLLLVHGFFENGLQLWRPVIPELAKSYRLIIPDLRGHGRSTNPSDEFSFVESANDIIGLLDYLDVKKCDAIGHSAGAMTLLCVAAQQPHRFSAMVLDGAAYRFDMKVKQRIAAAAAEARNSPGFFDDVGRRHIGGRPQVERLLNQFSRFAATNQDAGMHLTLEQVSNVTTRTLITCGDRDEFFPVEIAVEMFRALPNSALWVRANARHGWDGRDVPILEQALNFIQNKQGS